MICPHSFRKAGAGQRVVTRSAAWTKRLPGLRIALLRMVSRLVLRPSLPPQASALASGARSATRSAALGLPYGFLPIHPGPR